MSKQMGSDSFKNVIYQVCVYKSHLIYTCKQDLVSNNLHGLLCCEINPAQPTLINKIIYIYYIYICCLWMTSIYILYINDFFCANSNFFRLSFFFAYFIDNSFLLNVFITASGKFLYYTPNELDKHNLLQYLLVPRNRFYSPRRVHRCHSY